MHAPRHTTSSTASSDTESEGTPEGKAHTAAAAAAVPVHSHGGPLPEGLADGSERRGRSSRGSQLGTLQEQDVV